MAYLQVYFHQIKTIFNGIRITITTLPGNVYRQISSIIFIERRDIYIGIVPKKSQLGKQQDQNSMSSNVIIGMI